MYKTLEFLNLQGLASRLGLDQSDLLQLIRIAPKQYYEKIITKNNKTRILEIPYPLLKAKQKILLKEILSGLPTHPRQFGCPGTSIKDAVADHIRKPVVITLDIKNFFPSVKAGQVGAVLRRRKASSEVAKAITRLTTYKNHLPHGSPTSPCLARLVLNPLALNLERMMKSLHSDAAFSIYVDDITLSGPNGLTRLVPQVRRIVQRLGFALNEDKLAIMSRDREQESLGIRLNKRIEPTLSYLSELEEVKKLYPPSHPIVKGKQGFIAFLFRTDT